MENKLILTVGNIASGKSTWCRQKAQEGAIIVCNDDITTMVHGGLYDYNKDLKSVYKSIEIQSVISGLSAGRTVIVDRLNHTVSQRRKWVGIASAFDMACQVVLFPRDSPEEHAQRRFQCNSRGKSYETWLEVAKNFQKTYEDIDIEKEGIEMLSTFDNRPFRLIKQ